MGKIKMKNRSRFLSIIYLFTAVLLIMPSPVPAEGQDKGYDVPVETLAEQRVDIQAVIMALVYNLKGAREQGIGPVMFDEDFGRLSDGTGLSYREFQLVGAAITKDISLLDDERYRELSVVLEFADPGMRTAFLNVTVNYYLDTDLIFVEKAVAEPLYADRGQVQFYYLPLKELPPLPEMKQMGYPEIAEMIAQCSLAPEALKSMPANRMSQLRVIAVNQCRVRPDVQLSLSIAGDDDAYLAIAKRADAWNLNGWSIAVSDGAFILNTEPGFFIEVSKTEVTGSSKTNTLIDQFPSIFKD